MFFRFLNLVAGCFLFVQIAAAQSNPAISQEYSNEAIADMIQKHKASSSSDVIPTPELAAKFKADFPKAHRAEWEIAEGIYEVEFDVKSRDFKAYYDAKGNLLMVVEEISRSELPAVVRNTAEAKYPNTVLRILRKLVAARKYFTRSRWNFVIMR